MALFTFTYYYIYIFISVYNKYIGNVFTMFGVRFKLGANTAISSRGDSSKFTLVKNVSANNIMYLPFRIKYVTIKSHCPYFFLEKGNVLKFHTDFNSNKCLQWKDTSTHKVLLRKIKKAKKEYIFNGCLLV